MEVRRSLIRPHQPNRSFMTALGPRAYIAIGVCGFIALVSLGLSTESTKWSNSLPSQETILKVMTPPSTRSSETLLKDTSVKYSKLTDPSRMKVRTKGYPTLASIDFYPWDYIVEPSRSTILEVPDTLLNEEYEYQWTIQERDYAGIVKLDGRVVLFTFTKPTTTYDVELVVTSHGEVITVQIAHMMCKYVRREIRSLLDEDREAYFRALGHVASGSPVAVPGETYLNASEKTLQYMMVKHIHTGTCSPFHNGNGFFTSHAAFTLELDQAMQAYDPSTLQPYWDYTIDSGLYGNDWYLKSPIFNDDWYGAASPRNDDRHVTTTWIDHIDNPVSWEAPVHNSFGIVTIATNNNPSQRVSRTHSFCNFETRLPLPTCHELEGCLQRKTLESIRACIEGQLHKDLHMGMGGIWDCHVDLQEFAEQWPETVLILAPLAMKSESLSNALWKRRYLKCPLSCELGSLFDDCRCSCPGIDDRIDILTWWESYDLLDDTGVLPKFDTFFKDTGVVGEDGKVRHHFKGVSTEASEALWKMLLDFGCHPGRYGNMCTGSSAGDPIFWPIHPFFDRLWMYMRLNRDGQFDHVKWAWVNNDDDCYGHRSYDAMPFSTLFGEETGPHYYSNSELFNNFRPENPSLPYVYDDFNWPHCWSSGQPEIN